MFFSKSNIYAKEWLDTVFKDRNQEYGAYQLRQLAPKATNTALGIVTTIVLCLCGFSYANSQCTPYHEPKEEDQTVALVMDAVDIAPIEELQTPPEADVSEQPQQVAQDISAQDLIKFTEINATNKSEVIEDVEVAHAVLDKKKLPANITMEGIKGGELIPKGTFGTRKRDGGNRGVSDGDITGNPDASSETFIHVEVMPEPVGGMKEFVQWVAENYEFPQGALDSGTKGLIHVSFIVEEDGTLSSFEVIRDMGYNTGGAAIKLLKKAKKWNPGIQNGRPVRVAFNLPIRLQVTN